MADHPATDWKALCAELVSIIEHHTPAHIYDLPYEAAAMQRARAALARLEPEGPTNEQAQELFQALRVPIYATRSPGMAEQIVGHEPVNPRDFARAVLIRWGRPKPQTLNSIALQMLDTIERDARYLPEITDTIRKALKEKAND